MDILNIESQITDIKLETAPETVFNFEKAPDVVFNIESDTPSVEGGLVNPLNVTPLRVAQTITASGEVAGYSPVNVAAVTADIDENIQPDNIVEGVSILGVAGSAEALNGAVLNVTPTTEGQTIHPTSPKNGFVRVNVEAVTAAIDSNIQSGNIKSGVTILGVAGSYSGGAVTVTAKNGTGAAINSGDKVWICKVAGDSTLYLRNFANIDNSSYSGYATTSGADGANITVETYIDTLEVVLSTTTDDAYLNVR